ncbi:hypothetical protein SADUNF_Sadunf10G0044500 [Salix dunnii]|uniref:Uncharacterized protein n=1 Tax=Salix dunnii TaxID=1413687 RepID=A0A835JSC4_9ROSI|nr:hypothetical protein SADUNF_Sadunf10G0044500 [Salix dunnii]
MGRLALVLDHLLYKGPERATFEAPDPTVIGGPVLGLSQCHERGGAAMEISVNERTVKLQ